MKPNPDYLRQQKKNVNNKTKKINKIETKIKKQKINLLFREHKNENLFSLEFSFKLHSN